MSEDLCRQQLEIAISGDYWDIARAILICYFSPSETNINLHSIVYDYKQGEICFWDGFRWKKKDKHVILHRFEDMIELYDALINDLRKDGLGKINEMKIRRIMSLMTKLRSSSFKQTVLNEILIMVAADFTNKYNLPPTPPSGIISVL